MLNAKRLLEADSVDEMDDGLIAAALEVMFPLRETDEAQFRVLARWRYTGKRYKVIIDTLVYPRMRSLPETLMNRLTPDVLNRFENLENLSICGPLLEAVRDRTRLRSLKIWRYWESPRESRVSLATLTALTELELHELFNSSGVADAVSVLTRLTVHTLQHDGDIDPEQHLAPLVHLTRLTLIETGFTEFPTTLTALRELGMDEEFTDENLRRLTQLTALSPYTGSDHITNGTIALLTGLTSIDLRYFPEVTGEGITGLNRLETLWLDDDPYDHNKYSDISRLTNLRTLLYVSSPSVTDDVLSCLTNLTRLQLISSDPEIAEFDPFTNHTVTDAGLAPLTRLTSLDVTRCEHITDAGLRPLVQLRELEMSGNERITGTAFVFLTHIRELKMYWGTRVRPSQLRQLPQDCVVEGGDSLLEEYVSMEKKLLELEKKVAELERRHA
jgi:hypothetical protein